MNEASLTSDDDDNSPTPSKYPCAKNEDMLKNVPKRKTERKKLSLF